MPRETAWGQRGMEWRYARNSYSSRSKHPLQYRRWKTQTDGKKLQQSEGQSSDWSWKFLVYGWQGWKISSCDYRHHPVCRGYESGNRCIHGYRCLRRRADGKSNLSARSKRRYTRISCYPEKKKKRLRLCSSKLSANGFYSTGSWRIGIERFGGTHLKFSGCTWYKIEFGKQKGNLEDLSEKGWTSWAKSLRARFWRTTTWGNLMTGRMWQQSSVEFGEKLCKLKPNT